MTTRRLAATLACGIVAAACHTASPDADRKAVADADRAFNRSTAERRAEGWTEFFAEDGAMIRSTGTITGKAAIHDVMTKTFADTSFTLTWEPDRGDVAGNIGYTDGHFEVRFRDDKGNAVSRTGRYLTVWKRQADGTWKVVRDIGVQDVKPQP